MVVYGVTNISALCSPFCQQELRLANEEYSHVAADIMDAFNVLFSKYIAAFLIPGSPLRRIQGIYHSFNTGDAMPQYRRPYRK